MRAVGAVKTAERRGETEAGRTCRAVGTALRIVIIVHALDTFAQAVLAGQFLSGNAGAVALHADNATRVLVILGYLQIVIAIVYWRLADRDRWLVPVSVGVGAAETIQIILGFSGLLAFHVPLGVAIIVAVAVLAGWAGRGLIRAR